MKIAIVNADAEQLALAMIKDTQAWRDCMHKAFYIINELRSNGPLEAVS